MKNAPKTAMSYMINSQREYAKKSKSEKNYKAFNTNRDETLMEQNKNRANSMSLVLTYTALYLI